MKNLSKMFNHFNIDFYDLSEYDDVNVNDFIKENKTILILNTIAAKSCDNTKVIETLNANDNIYENDNLFIVVANKPENYDESKVEDWIAKYYDIREYKVKEIVEKLKEGMVSFNNAELENLKYKVEEYTNDIQHLEVKLRNNFDMKLSYLRKIEEIEKGKDPISENIMKEIELISKHKLCSDISLDRRGGGIEITTNDIYMYDENDNRYYLGKMMFSIPIINVNENLRIYNLNNKRYSYWGEDCHHPHVSTTGNPCFGNTSSTVALYNTERQYYALFLLLVNYCQSVDINDAAGLYVVSWDKVDEEGNIIEEGHSPYTTECAICGDIYNEDEGYVCNDCGRGICGECGTFIDGVFVCNECLEEQYFYCHNCETYVPKEQTVVIYGEDGGFVVCEECAETFNYCEECGKYFTDNLYDGEYNMCLDCVESREE